MLFYFQGTLLVGFDAEAMIKSLRIPIVKLKDKELEYVIVNHLEPDHSSSLPEVVKTAPNVKIVGISRAIDMVRSFFHLDQETVSVKDGDILGIGSRTLRFIEVPWLHWPETMFTYFG